MLLWAALTGFLFFVEVPDRWVVCGGGLIVVSGVAALRHASPLYLPYISPISPLYLPFNSPISSPGVTALRLRPAGTARVPTAGTASAASPAASSSTLSSAGAGAKGRGMRAWAELQELEAEDAGEVPHGDPAGLASAAQHFPVHINNSPILSTV